ncbi:hypothetical protein GPK34_00735 [Secundilactobacillus kimchicus]|uniref:hypothetical protein n=1 Tax=Secundilactobacillus kimchicus TaxID=528209 RepID=UPI001C02186C|nr:hypothetical protein [Secundilactobacillus kimchicus]MBT9670564.1 hypothetical protein [Secundilactobacillus kimchicus]
MIGLSKKDTSRHLQRIALRLTDNGTVTDFKFQINPNSIQENFPARNTFIQTENTIQMQGFGAGLHTISISGTTGVNPSRGSSGTTGFQKYQELYTLLNKQLKSAKDSQAGMSTSQVKSGVVLDYLDYTNEHYYTVELSPEGFGFNQSADNPLSYTYSMNFVVLKETSQPTYEETSWVVLGNVKPTLSKKSLKLVQENQAYLKLADRYQGKLYKDGYKTKYAAAKAEAKKMAQDMAKRGYDGTRSPIINYYDNTNNPKLAGGVYALKKTLKPGAIKNIYKTVYSGIHKIVHVRVNNQNIADLEVSSDDAESWDAYWQLFMDNSAKLNRRDGTVINYGQNDAGDSNQNLPDYDEEAIKKKLYGKTVPILDLTQFGSADEIYRKLYGNVVTNLDGDSYTAASKAFQGSIRATILNYGQVDANDIYKTATPVDLQETYQTIYSQTVNGFDNSKYKAASALFTELKQGTINNYTDYDEGADAKFPSMQNMYSILYGQSLDYDTYREYEQSLNDTDSSYENDIDYGQILSNYEEQNQNVYGLQENDYVKIQDINAYMRRAQPQIEDTLSWEDATQVTANVSGTNDLYKTANSTFDSSNELVASSDTYTNPYVSQDAPIFSYNEISNILKM